MTIKAPYKPAPAKAADAILDRLVHNAHRIDLTGDSLRRRRPVSAPRAVD